MVSLRGPCDRASDRMGDEGWEEPRLPHKGGTGGVGLFEFESCLRQAVWGFMETHEVQQVCTTGCLHSWVPSFIPPYFWQGLGPQHLYHLGTWWTFRVLPKFQSIIYSGVG